MDADTYPNAAVVAFARESLVSVKVNGEKSPQIAQKYSVQGYPAILFVDGDGIEVSRIAGYAPPAPFLAKARRIVKLKGARETLKSQADDPASLEVVGEDQLDNEKYDAARETFTRLAALDAKDEKGFGAKAHFQLALVHLFSTNDAAKAEEEFGRVKELDPTDKRELADDIAYFKLQAFAARKDMEGLLAAARTFVTTYPKSDKYDDVVVIIGKVQYHLGKRQEAVATFEQFLKDRPASLLGDEVRAMIDHIQKELSGGGKPEAPGGGSK